MKTFISLCGLWFGLVGVMHGQNHYFFVPEVSANYPDPDLIAEMPEFLPGPVEVTVRSGEVAVLPCAVRHLGDGRVAWKNKTSDTYLVLGAYILVQDADISVEHSMEPDHVTRGNLVIQNVQLADAGQYECQALSAGERFLRTVTLHVVATAPPPEFLPEPVDITARTGEVTVLPCGVRHLGTKSVAWVNKTSDRIMTIGTYTFVDDADISVEHSSEPDHVTRWNLVIQNVQLSDAGTYECQVSSRGQRPVHRVTLHVLFTAPPPQFPTGPVNVTVRPGEVAVLPCAVKHLGYNSVAWLNKTSDLFLSIGTNTFVDDDDISVEHSSEPDHVTRWNLVIQNVQPSDAGTYECQVSSRGQRPIHRVSLLVVDEQRRGVNECPDSERLRCFVSPCQVTTCELEGDQMECRADYCGGCRARFFTAAGTEVTDDCEANRGRAPRRAVNVCPDSERWRCLISPCQFPTCEIGGNQMTCWTDYCGGCRARFFNAAGTEVTDVCKRNRRNNHN